MGGIKPGLGGAIPGVKGCGGIGLACRFDAMGGLGGNDPGAGETFPFMGGYIEGIGDFTLLSPKFMTPICWAN